MDPSMIFFEAAPLSVLLILVSRAIIKINKQRLRFQFFISDIWMVTLCLSPSVWFISNALTHSDDGSAMFLALLVAQCQVLGITLGRLRHTLSRRTGGSWLYIAAGSLVGLAFVFGTFVAFWGYILMFTRIGVVKGPAIIIFICLPILVLTLLVAHTAHTIKKQRLPFQFYISDLWAVMLFLSPSICCIANAFSNAADTDALFVLLTVAPCQLLGIYFGRLRYTVAQRTDLSFLYVAGGSLLGLAFALATCVAYAIYHFSIAPIRIM